MALVFRVSGGGGGASLPNVTITDELDAVDPPNSYITGLNQSGQLYNYPTTNGFQLVWDSSGEITTIHASNNSTSTPSTTTLSSGAEKVLYASTTATLKVPSAFGGGTVSNVKGFVLVSVGSLTDAQVAAALNNESGISGVQSSQVMHDGDGWWSWSHPVHDPGIDNFAIVYLLSSQVS